eukprot:11279216-Alexandrium_andersonii.AAC.1
MSTSAVHARGWHDECRHTPIACPRSARAHVCRPPCLPACPALAATQGLACLWPPRMPWLLVLPCTPQG